LQNQSFFYKNGLLQTTEDSLEFGISYLGLEFNLVSKK